ncbi:hypothetical protein JCM10212_004848 [Sporobolomyces blumeae]
MLPTSILAFFLPLSIVRPNPAPPPSALAGLEPRPRQSLRSSSHRLPVAFVRLDSVDARTTRPVELAARLSSRSTAKQTDEEPLSLDEDDEESEAENIVDDAGWEFGPADEEELRQEQELWETLLRSTSKDGKVSRLFADLVRRELIEDIDDAVSPYIVEFGPPSTSQAFASAKLR